MKRPSSPLAESDRDSPKRLKCSEQGGEAVTLPAAAAASAADLGEDLVLEILKRADAKTLARAACVSRRWRRMTEDERIWEAVCTRHWASIGCGAHQLRAVVLALGGFRRLHSVYLLPLLQPSHVPRRGIPTLPVAGKGGHVPAAARWGKDEVQLSMALLSIGYFMNGNFGGIKKGSGSGSGLGER